MFEQLRPTQWGAGVSNMCQRGTSQWCPPGISIDDDAPDDPMWFGHFHRRIYGDWNNVRHQKPH